MFDNITEVANYVWMWTWEGGSAWYVLEWTLSKRLVAYSKIDLSLLQHQSASQEKHGSMGDSTLSSISLLGILGPGPGDRRLCMRLALHVHYRPFSVTSEESLRDSERPLNGYPSTKGQETS